MKEIEKRRTDIYLSKDCFVPARMLGSKSTGSVGHAIIFSKSTPEDIFLFCNDKQKPDEICEQGVSEVVLNCKKCIAKLRTYFGYVEFLQNLRANTIETIPIHYSLGITKKEKIVVFWTMPINLNMGRPNEKAVETVIEHSFNLSINWENIACHCYYSKNLGIPGGKFEVTELIKL